MKSAFRYNRHLTYCVDTTRRQWARLNEIELILKYPRRLCTKTMLQWLQANFVKGSVYKAILWP